MCFLRRLPYPEEKPDYTQTLDNANTDGIITDWMMNYFVPEVYRDWWRENIVVTLTTKIPYPAQAWGQDGKRYLDIRPEWLNPGVIAHEQAHNSYSMLSDIDKQFFSVVYNKLKTTDTYIKLLYKKNIYGLSSDIEGHAETYRYIGYKMTDVLKQYYPYLF